MARVRRKLELIASTLVMWKLVVGFGMWRSVVFFKHQWVWQEIDVSAYKSATPDPDEESLYTRLTYNTMGDADQTVLEASHLNASGQLGAKELRERRAIRARLTMKRTIHRVVIQLNVKFSE